MKSKPFNHPYNERHLMNAITGWITDADLRFKDVQNYTLYAPSKGSIQGVKAHNVWVLFHGLQVIKIVPQEVHSYWHLDQRETEEIYAIYEISSSAWLKTFRPHHLKEHSHFVLSFEDDVIEVICKNLFFGKAPFDLKTAIEDNPQLSFPYYQLGCVQEKDENIADAICSFEKYLSLKHDSEEALVGFDVVSRKLNALKQCI